MVEPKSILTIDDFDANCNEIMGYLESMGWNRIYSKLILDTIHANFDSMFEKLPNPIREEVLRSNEQQYSMYDNISVFVPRRWELIN